MKNRLLGKCIVFMTIVLFVGVSIHPSTIGTIKENTVSPGFGLRGYIQSVIDNASDGDTIYIPSGIYYESIYINKTISLIGEDKNTTIIDGCGVNVIFIFSDWVNISGFTIQNGGDPWWAASGIYLSKLSNNSTISDNIIINSWFGINLYGAINTTISNNIITNNNDTGIVITNNKDTGIYLQSNNNNNIINNIITNNNEYGIQIWSYYNTISGNNITNNGYGIGLFAGKSNTISGNIITNNNEYGIQILSDNNIIVENNISNNHDFGIRIDIFDADNNTIFHNNFINNTINAIDSFNNIWDNDYPSGGNYWDDYTGADNNGDGIGDTPYNIPGGSNQDQFPFIEPDGWLIKPEFKKAFIFGRITNHSTVGDYIIFEAAKTRVLTFKPFDVHKYVSGEMCYLLEDYYGFIGKRYIFAFCEIMIRG